MAVARWLETDSNSNIDISGATAIGAYTADADRMVVCDVSLDAVAGSGDYVIYLTRQINGAGSAYVLLPKTTCTAASGETAIAMQSGPVTVRSGDVVTCYIDGLAGDTTTPDTVVRWFEMAALRPATAGRTLNVDANGALTTVTNLINAPTAGDLTATMKTSVAAATWNAVAASYATAGTFGALVGGIATIATTLQNRMGAWTGTGVNTVLGAFKAALSKSATVPSDIGGTFDPAADSTEAISEAVAGIGAATGSGAISFPVTVNDEDSNPIDGVEVWISTDSAGTSVVAGTLSTSALGVATFMLDAGTYYLWRQKSGYNFANPVTIVVS